jgi:hypothetical protein
VGNYLLKVGFELVSADGETPGLRSLDVLTEMQRRLRAAVLSE